MSTAKPSSRLPQWPEIGSIRSLPPKMSSHICSSSSHKKGSMTAYHPSAMQPRPSRQSSIPRQPEPAARGKRTLEGQPKNIIKIRKRCPQQCRWPLRLEFPARGMMLMQVALVRCGRNAKIGEHLLKAAMVVDASSHSRVCRAGRPLKAKHRCLPAP